jgi:hypothetical protein
MKLKSFEVSDRSVICPTHPLNFFGCVVNPIKNGRQRERLYVFIWIPTGPRSNHISTRILSLYSFCHFLETIYFLFLSFLSRFLAVSYHEIAMTLSTFIASMMESAHKRRKMSCPSVEPGSE